MKILFASDIHGDAADSENLKKKFYEEKADNLVLCGDLLYHGPRNNLPENYEPKKVIEILNSLSEHITAVRGNCDSEVDQMVLNFPMLSDYVVILDGNRRMFVTHGHIFNNENKLKVKNNDIMICGHTHVLSAEKRENYIYLNPGSVSLPKENNPKTYMIYENGKFTIKDFNNNIIKEYVIS